MVSIRCLAALVLAASAAPAQTATGEPPPPVTITYRAMRPALIEERLRSAPKKQADRAPALEEMFRSAGCGPQLTTQPVKGEKAPNIVCRLPGKTSAEILIGAHFDLSNSDGVADNWSGASLLPTLFETLNATPRNHTFVFVGFTSEEKGLIGSKAYVKHNDLTNIRAMINLDTLGLDESKVWTSRSDKTLLKYLRETASVMKLPIAGVDVERVGSTDSESFREKKIPSIAIHSLTQENFQLLHTSGDRIEAINFDAYQRTYKLLAAYLAYLDRKLD